MVKKSGEEKDEKNLDKLLNSLQEQYGEGVIMRLGDVKKVDVKTISTGSFSLDLALGVGGFPCGRIVEMFGPESSGKSTLALHAIAEAQKKGEKVAYIDAEHAMDPDY